jgi:predicted GIY-YIG superfamily endonuclease
MTLKELMQLPNEEQLIVINKLNENNCEISSELKMLYGIYEESRIRKLPPEESLAALIKLKEDKSQLSSISLKIYEKLEEERVAKLPYEERLRIFNKYKEDWCVVYPDFKRISDIMEDFKTNEMLVEYGKHSPPEFIHNRAIDIYKKCISYKVKLTKKVLSPLINHPDQLDIHCHYVKYCIDQNIVKSFLKEYQIWNNKIYSLWNQVYYLKNDFFYNTGYDRTSWKSYVKYSDSLKRKLNEVEKLHEKILTLLIEGQELVLKLDKTITLEYETNATEMSLYERELEILQIYEGDSSNDEEYCYVYTLECELFIFYVGIAADPKERFEQHIRGAYSDEAHLFKSKFIQKYHREVKQKIIHEGTRKECKKFEKDYISKYSPLGNMTDGGEG